MQRKEIQEMGAGELVHYMLVTFSEHRVSRDRNGDPDECDTPWLQDGDYGAACERLNDLLPAPGLTP